MGKHDKLLEKLNRKPTPKNITYDEIESLLKKLGFVQENKGKTSGSSVMFVGAKSTVQIHRPHPRKELLQYQIKEIISGLKEEGVL